MGMTLAGDGMGMGMALAGDGMEWDGMGMALAGDGASPPPGMGPFFPAVTPITTTLRPALPVPGCPVGTPAPYLPIPHVPAPKKPPQSWPFSNLIDLLKN